MLPFNQSLNEPYDTFLLPLISQVRSYLVPLLGQQDEAVVVDQETVEILNRKQKKKKKQKKKCVCVCITKVWCLVTSRRSSRILTALSQLRGHTPSMLVHWERRRDEVRGQRHEQLSAHRKLTGSWQEADRKLTGSWQEADRKLQEINTLNL